MTAPGAFATLVVNCAAIATGDLDAPRADGDAIAIRDGRIAAIGHSSGFDRGAFDLVVDARGTTAAPGLIDPHVHPMLGDWHPRQAVFGWMEAALQGGVTSMLSQGTNLLPGRPRDAFSTKALAVLVRPDRVVASLARGPSLPPLPWPARPAPAPASTEALA